MKLKPIRNLPTTDEITEENSVLVARDGGISRMVMQKFRKYIAYATGADVLGVPVPTAADAGKAPVVNKRGEYTLESVANTCLLWENPEPYAAFASQTIACDTAGYSMFTVVFKYSNSSTERETVSFPNDRNNAKLYSISFSGVSIARAKRDVTATAAGILFGSGSYAVYDGGSETVSNAHAVPVAIYGIG